MDIEKNFDGYVGDVVGGLIREAAALKAKCSYLESVIEGMKKDAQVNAAPAADEYISQEHFKT